MAFTISVAKQVPAKAKLQGVPNNLSIPVKDTLSYHVLSTLSCASPLSARIPLLQALIGLFELPEDDTIPDEEHFIDIEDTPGYQTAFSQLAFAGRKEHDPVGQMVNNPRIHLAQSLHKLSTACPGRVGDCSCMLVLQRRNAPVRMGSADV